MCALCWTEEFCFDSERPEGEQIYDPPCDDISHAAQPADRVTGALLPREGGFFCVPPSEEKFVGGLPDLSCPADTLPYENVAPCVDTPACAVLPEDDCGAPPEEPLCPDAQTDGLRTACVENPTADYKACTVNYAHGAALAVDQLIANCSPYGTVPPEDAPSRYCFLSCVTSSSCILDDPEQDGCNGCSPSSSGDGGGGGGAESESATEPAAEADATASASTSPSAFPILIDPSQSAVTVLQREGDRVEILGRLGVEGTVRIDIPSNCFYPGEDTNCPARIESVRLFSSGALTIKEHRISSARMFDSGDLNGIFATGPSEGKLSIEPPVVFALNGTVGDNAHAYVPMVTSAPVLVDIDWSRRRASLSLESEGDGITFEMELVGEFPSITPTAIVAASASSEECGRKVILSAISSTDPDDDIEQVLWSSEWSDGFVWQAAGDSVIALPPLGLTRFHAVVSDAAGTPDFDYVDVVVSDRTPPVLQVAARRVDYACAPGPLQLAPTSLEDSCDNDPDLRVEIVSVNGVRVEKAWQPSYAFGFGVTVVRYTATDASGNSVTAVQDVVLERGPNCGDER